MNTRMNRGRLNIGTYILQPYARTEEHIKDLHDCGIDFVCCLGDASRETLDLFEKYHVGAIQNDIVPGWWGGDGANAGKLAESNPLSAYREAAAKFADHPAVWGIDIGDEPSALDFPHYGKVAENVNRLFPKQFPYLNLYPNYASVSQNNAEQTVNQLGTPTYAEHIDEYCKYVGLDYLCYDFYMYSANVHLAYENLRIVADACRSSGRSMWIVLQVNSNKPEEWISANRLRFQASSAMAFGAENIIWACYTAGWWHNQVLDDKGEKTEQYDKLKTVNTEIRAVADAYMRYRNTATHFIGFAGHPDFSGVCANTKESLSTGTFMDVREKDGAPLLVGQMTARDCIGRYALWLCPCDDPRDTDPAVRTVVFRCDGKNVVLHTPAGTETLKADADGVYSVSLPSCSGALVEAI